MTIRILQGDATAKLRELPADSFAACVTDPPYHLTSIVKRFGGENAAPAKSNGDTGVYGRASKGFMGKTWDGGDVAFRPETWAAVSRVLRPGAHLVAFGGTRTFHRLVCAIEDAGFEIRDTIMWLYGSGFPKSLDVNKAIDRARRRDYVQAAVERGVPLPGRSVDDWTKEDHAPSDKWWSEFKSALPVESWAAIERRVIGTTVSGDTAWFSPGVGDITAPATEAARQWQGWGTALKPACELICLARKPLSEGTVATNVLRHGTGAINVDAGRVGTSKDVPASPCRTDSKIYGNGSSLTTGDTPGFDPNTGRWPANCAHDGSPEVLEAFARFGERSGQAAAVNGLEPSQCHSNVYSGPRDRQPFEPRGDTGTAARFFFCGKAHPWEREGNHPTVKPVALMEWLVSLVTPPGGHVLDPFCGTGSTLVACDHFGFDATGIELSAETCVDAERKIRRLRARRLLGSDAPRHEPLPGQLGLAL